MMNKQEISNRLRGFTTEYIRDRQTGICGNMIDLYWFGGLDFIYKSWSFYSGNTMFPVPHPFIPDPHEAFAETEDLWEGDYGLNRKLLCLYVADKLDKMSNLEFKVRKWWHDL